MELRWTEEAAGDLERVTDYLFQNAPAQAVGLVRGIYNAPAVEAICLTGHKRRYNENVSPAQSRGRLDLGRPSWRIRSVGLNPPSIRRFSPDEAPMKGRHYVQAR